MPSRVGRTLGGRRPPCQMRAVVLWITGWAVDGLAWRQSVRYAAELVFDVVAGAELDEPLESEDFSDLPFELPDSAEPPDPLGLSPLLDLPFLEPLLVARESVR